MELKYKVIKVLATMILPGTEEHSKLDLTGVVNWFYEHEHVSKVDFCNDQRNEWAYITLVEEVK